MERSGFCYLEDGPLVDRSEISRAPTGMVPAESGGPTMFARIGVMRALNHGKPDTAPMPRRKGARAYKVIR